MVEIKTLKIEKNNIQLSNPKGLLNPKLVFTLPHGIDLNTSYPLSLLSPIHARGKFLQMHFLSLIWFLLPLLSPLRTRDLSSPRFDFHSLFHFFSTCGSSFPLRMWVGFPSIQFSLPFPSLLHAWVKFPPTQFPLTFSISF